MNLLHLHLHPFGKFTDEHYDLQPGLHVVEGPNERGKSTMSHAIKHALFTPTSLTPAKMKKVIGDWFPLPHGTECSVRLGVEHDGITYTISKTWSAHGTTHVTGSDGTDAIGADAEARIASIVGFNEATWEYVFHTSQAALADTIAMLNDHSKSMDDIVAGTSTLANDISPERFLSLMDERISKHYKYWDQLLGRPRDGRGIDNPWTRDVGTLLAAYYVWQRALADLANADAYNARVDMLQGAVARLTERELELDGLVQQGKTLREQLQQGSTLTMRVEQLREAVAEQRKAYDAWPMAERDVADATARVTALQALIETLSVEQDRATQYQQAQGLRASYARIVEAKQALDAAEQRLRGRTAVTEEALRTVLTLTQRINDLDISIRAHRLAATIQADHDAVVSVVAGTGTAENVSLLSQQPWTNDAVPGMIAISHNGVTLTVRSATGDVTQMLVDRQDAEQTLERLLQDAGFDTADAVQTARDVYIKAEQDLHSQQRLLDQLLNGKPYEQWTSEFQTAQDLGTVRDVQAVNADMQRTTLALAEQRGTLERLHNQIEHFEAMYGSRDDLFTLMSERHAMLKTANDALAAMPPVPHGYADANAYLRALEQAQDELHSVRNEKTAKQSELEHMPAPNLEGSLSDLSDRVHLAKVTYERMVQEGEALQRIRAAVERATGQTDAGPMQALPSLISDYFSRLTNGRYSSVAMEQMIPLHATGAAVRDLPVERLSRGTKTSLALATRLALAEAYLQERSGVIMLDDPCVDMDAERRAAAMQVLGDVSRKHQVIMFTCHPQS